MTPSGIEPATFRLVSPPIAPFVMLDLSLQHCLLCLVMLVRKFAISALGSALSCTQQTLARLDKSLAACRHFRLSYCSWLGGGGHVTEAQWRHTPGYTHEEGKLITAGRRVLAGLSYTVVVSKQVRLGIFRWPHKTGSFLFNKYFHTHHLNTAYKRHASYLANGFPDQGIPSIT